MLVDFYCEEKQSESRHLIVVPFTALPSSRSPSPNSQTSIPKHSSHRGAVRASWTEDNITSSPRHHTCHLFLFISTKQTFIVTLYYIIIRMGRFVVSEVEVDIKKKFTIIESAILRGNLYIHDNESNYSCI